MITDYSRFAWRSPRRVLGPIALLAFSLAGCGSAPDGPPRYQLSGSVTYDGKPVVAGFITFIPDTAKGNSGPGGGAPIKEGRYQTELGKGPVGGMHIVRIIGYDGVKTVIEGEELTDGKPLFSPHEASYDLPKKDGTFDFTVPVKKP